MLLLEGQGRLYTFNNFKRQLILCLMEKSAGHYMCNSGVKSTFTCFRSIGHNWKFVRRDKVNCIFSYILNQLAPNDINFTTLNINASYGQVAFFDHISSSQSYKVRYTLDCYLNMAQYDILVSF